MAADPDGLDLDLAKAVYDEMLAIVEKEANRRHRLAKMVSCEFYLVYQRIICYRLANGLVTKQKQSLCVNSFFNDPTLQLYIYALYFL